MTPAQRQGLGVWEKRQTNTFITKKSRLKRASQLEYRMSHDVHAKENRQRKNIRTQHHLRKQKLTTV